MTSRDFCFWLQGFFEVADPTIMDSREVEMVKRHLSLVFKHEIDPSMPDPTGELQNIHDGINSVKPNTPSGMILRC